MMQAKPGGKLVLFCFSEQNPQPWKGPDLLTQDDLHCLFNQASGWRITSITPTLFDLGKSNARTFRLTDHVWRLVAVRL